MHTYLKYLPETPTSPITLVMLHGVGSDEKDLFALHKHFSDYRVFSLRAPIELPAHGFAWYHIDFSTGRPTYTYDDIVASGRYIQEFLQYLSVTYNIDRENIVLFGFSQWAIMSYYTLLTFPRSIQGIIGLSGRLLQELEAASLEQIQNKKIFLGHGAFDGVIKVQEAEKLQKFFENSHLSLTYKIYSMPHSVSPEEIQDIQSWLKDF